MNRKTRRANGYSMVELLVTMVVLGIAVTMGFPALQTQIKRGRLTSTVDNVKTQMLVARHEAVRQGFPVVARPIFKKRELLIFANVDEDTGYAYQPNSSEPFRSVDYELATIELTVAAPGRARRARP